MITTTPTTTITTTITTTATDICNKKILLLHPTIADFRLLPLRTDRKMGARSTTVAACAAASAVLSGERKKWGGNHVKPLAALWCT